MQPRMWLGFFWAVGLLCWVMLSFPPMNAPKSFFPGLLSFHSLPRLCLCLGLPWPRSLSLVKLHGWGCAQSQAHVTSMATRVRAQGRNLRTPLPMHTSKNNCHFCWVFLKYCVHEPHGQSCWHHCGNNRESQLPSEWPSEALWSRVNS